MIDLRENRRKTDENPPNPDPLKGGIISDSAEYQPIALKKGVGNPLSDSYAHRMQSARFVFALGGR